MSLSIIGAGLMRTGTLSLKNAIEQLGFGPCFHGLANTRRSVERMFDAIIRPETDWDEVFQGFQAAVDVPACWIYRELAREYPAAKIILTIRESNDWFDSMQFLQSSLATMPLSGSSLTLRQNLRKKMSSGVFGTPIAQLVGSSDRDSKIAAYEQHNAEVREWIRPDRLLVFDVREGWEPLCRFLNVPIPDTPFPRFNSRAGLPALLRCFYAIPEDAPVQDELTPLS
jgi:hypothetical protein